MSVLEDLTVVDSRLYAGLDPEAMFFVTGQAEAIAVEAGIASPLDWCETCDRPVGIVDAGSNPGFTGATIYWANLRCGHSNVDDSADTLEAVR